MHCSLVGNDAVIELLHFGHFMCDSICLLRRAVSRITLVGSGTADPFLVDDCVVNDDTASDDPRNNVLGWDETCGVSLVLSLVLLLLFLDRNLGSKTED